MKDTNEKTSERYKEILDSYGLLLRRVIVRMCPKDIGLQFDDIEQEARIKLWRALESEREITNYPSYLYRIASSVTIDAIRKARVRREDQIFSECDDKEKPAKFHAEFSSAKNDSPEDNAQRLETIEKAARVLDGLSDVRKQAVRLYLQGLTTAEIAELVGWTEAKARNLLYRGLRELREGLKQEGIVYER